MEPAKVNNEKKVSYKPKRGKKIMIIAACTITIGAIAATYALKIRSKTVQDTIVQRTAAVTRGDISVTVSGSGSIVSSNTVDITSLASGKITKVYYKEGDSVKAGDLMFEIDDSDALLKVRQLENTIAQTNLSAASNASNIENLSIKAPISGRLTDVIDINIGDEISKGMTIATITDTSKLKIQVPFSSSVVEEISVGQKAIVNIQEFMQSITGEVSYINDVPSDTSSGITTYTVEVVLDNSSGILKEGMTASVEVDTQNGYQMSMKAGQLQYIDSKVVTSKSSGTVKSLNMKKNQYVNSGDVLVQLQNDDLLISSQTTELKLEDLNAQLETAKKQLENYKIYAPIDGVITSLDAEANKTINAGSVLATIMDDKNMEFDISIDELDIQKIQIGQKANITIDALTETTTNPLSGEVTKIAIEGTSGNGVTTYPVTVKINETENLKVGMNANAEIITSEKENVLLIPLEAVQTINNKSFVWVKIASSVDNPEDGNIRGKQNVKDAFDDKAPGNTGYGAQNVPGEKDSDYQKDTSRKMQTKVNKGVTGRNGDYYAGAVLTKIETGINNDDYIEVVSGLKEGDLVVLPQLTSSSETDKNLQMNMQFGGFGRLGGGAMPSSGGSFPGGGFRVPNSSGNLGGGSRTQGSRNTSGNRSMRQW